MITTAIASRTSLRPTGNLDTNVAGLAGVDG